MTISNLSCDSISDLSRVINEISDKTQEIITDHNSLKSTFTSFDTAVDALTSPITITIDTITVVAVNAALVTVKGQLDTIITALKS